MTTHSRFLVAVTILNGAFALVSLSQLNAANAASEAAPVLRGRALEIVDGQGRVRASIRVDAPDPSVRMPDGSPSVDAAVLRLINPDGRPGVKLASSERDVGFSLIGSQGNYIQVFPSGVIVTKDRQQRATWP